MKSEISNSIDRQSRKKYYIYIAVIVTFLLILLLNIFTPMMADDFSYAFSYKNFNHERVQSIGDAFLSQIGHYRLWGGRSIVHFFAQVFIFLGKNIFSIVNSFVYILLTVFVYLHINYGKKSDVKLYILLNLMIWFFMPAFGQTILWLTGSCNYLWGTTIIVGFLLFFRIYFENSDKLKTNWLIPLLFVLGVAAGWCNENTSAACFLLSVLFIICYKIKKIKIPLWSYFGSAGCLIGFIIMIKAPGNYRRMSFMPKSDKSILQKFIYNILFDTKQLFVKLWIPILIFVLLFIICIILKKKSNLLLPSIYFITFFACNYAMILSPSFPERAMFGLTIFLIIAILQILREFENKDYNYIFVLIISIACVLFSYQYYNAYQNIKFSYDFISKREEYVLSEKEKGNLEIKSYQVVTNSKYNGAFNDITSDKTDWRNKAFSRYYGIKSIESTRKISK